MYFEENKSFAIFFSFNEETDRQSTVTVIQHTCTQNPTIHASTENINYSFSKDILIQSKAISGCPNDTFLLIFVSSNPTNTRFRQASRNSWARSCQVVTRNKRELGVKVLFLFGNATKQSINKQLMNESKQYNDVLQFDFIESYRNLTLKTLNALQWAVEKCPQVRYVMKVDDDIVVNVKRVLHLLEGSTPQRSITGACNSGAIVSRLPNKYYVPYREYAPKKYPTYTAGHGYVISADVIRDLLDSTKRIPLVSMEDAYITGILRTATNSITLQCCVGFSKAKYSTLPEVFHENSSTVSVAKPDDMPKFWQHYNSSTITDTKCTRRL